MKRITVFLFVMLFLLSGCSAKNDMITKIEKPKGKVREFLEQAQTENGVYLLDVSATKKYLFLNGSVHLEDEKPIYYSDVMAVTDMDKNLNISFTEYEAGTEKKEDMESFLSFEIILPNEIDTIRLYKNGEETSFKTIYLTEN